MPPFAVACALLVVAGIFKLRSSEAARSSLTTLGLRLPGLAIRALGLVEIGVGCLAAVRPGTDPAIAVAVLYGAFLVTALALLRKGEAADCGCFGAASSTIGPAHAIFNGLACAVALAAVVAGPRGIGWIGTRAPLVAVVLVLGMAAATYAAYAVFTLFSPAWRSYGSGGTV